MLPSSMKVTPSNSGELKRNGINCFLQRSVAKQVPLKLTTNPAQKHE